VALACAEYAHCVPGAAHGRVWIPLGALPHRQPGRLTLFELADAIARPIVIKPNRNRMHADDELILNNFDIDIA
jgi:hypothetical protein